MKYLFILPTNLILIILITLIFLILGILSVIFEFKFKTLINNIKCIKYNSTKYNWFKQIIITKQKYNTYLSGMG